MLNHVKYFTPQQNIYYELNKETENAKRRARYHEQKKLAELIFFDFFIIVIIIYIIKYNFICISNH